MLICDSTWWELTKSFKLENFFGRFGGKYSKTPQCKLQLVFDYMAGTIKQIDITKSTANDPAYHKQLLSLLKEKALLILDLGYFSLKFFSKINERGAYFISRLKFGITMYHLETLSRLDLLYIAKKSNENQFEFRALLGSEKLESRIIGIKVPRDVEKARQEKYQDTCRRKKWRVDQKHLEQLGWSFFITNISEKIMPAAQIILLYSIRWQIELIIKTLKSILSIDFTMVRENVNRIICEVYGRLILASFLTRVHSAVNEISCRECEGELSMDKMFKRFKDRSTKLAELFLRDQRKAIKYFDEIVELCLYTCLKERRKTRPTSKEILRITPPKHFVKLTQCFLRSLS